MNRHTLKPRLLLSATLILVILLAGACTRVSPLIKIGLVGPFEGRHRDIGYDVIYSARLMIRQANEAGGVGRYRLNLVAIDDFGSPEIARQMAEAMVADPGVVIVIGHWLTDTTRVSQQIYEEAGLPNIAVPSPVFAEIMPNRLPAEFLAEYAEITPFDEVAGPWAGAAYDATGLALSAMSIAWKEEGRIDRTGVGDALDGLVYEGITGPVFSEGSFEGGKMTDRREDHG